MEIRLKENLYINLERTHIIPRGAIGVMNKRVVNFYDTTKTYSVGFDRDTCLQCPELFSVKNQLSDRDINYKELLELLGSCSGMFKTKEDFDRFSEIIKSL